TVRAHRRSAGRIMERAVVDRVSRHRCADAEVIVVSADQHCFVPELPPSPPTSDHIARCRTGNGTANCRLDAGLQRYRLEASHGGPIAETIQILSSLREEPS